LFLVFLIYGFKLERKIPGSFFLPGRGRVSWQEANDAMQKAQGAQEDLTDMIVDRAFSTPVTPQKE